MRVIIAGASGFLGKKVLKNLTDNGFEAIGLTRQKLPGLLQVYSYADAPPGDALLHLAESSDRSWTNTQGTAYEAEAAATLQALLAKRYFRFVYTSSAVLYGDACNWPRRADEAINMVDSYTRIKCSSEQAVLAAGGAVARLSNLYGPGMSEGNVVSTILKQLPQQGPISVQDTSPVRDFLWVDDAAQAMATMVQSNSSGIFNVGTSIGTSIKELAQTTLRIAGQGERGVISRNTSTKSSTLTVDISKTTEAFGWHPHTALADGIGQLVRQG